MAGNGLFKFTVFYHSLGSFYTLTVITTPQHHHRSSELIKECSIVQSLRGEEGDRSGSIVFSLESKHAPGPKWEHYFLTTSHILGHANWRN